MAGRIETVVEELALKLLRDSSIELIDVEYVKERDWYLRVYIDKEGGIDIEDCQWLSELLEKELDEIDLIQGSYYLEVSSPGIDRVLKKEKDLVRHENDMVEVTGYAPIDGEKVIIGRLTGHTDDAYEIDGKRIERSKVAQIRLYVEI